MFYQYKDISLYYEKYGDKGKNIIIIPGWGNNRKTFYYMINFLKKYHTVYIIDLPGFGNSSFSHNDLTIYDYTLLIKSFIENKNIDNPILIGHSFGGRIIITLSGYYRIKIDKIILIDSAGIKPKKNIFRLFKLYLYKFLKSLKFFIPKKNKKNYLKKLINIFGSNNYKNLNNNMRKTFINIVNEDLKYYLKDIEAETLIIWGKDDKDTLLKDGKKMNKLIKNSALIELTGDHFCYLYNKILINRIIYAFLKDE